MIALLLHHPARMYEVHAAEERHVLLLFHTERLYGPSNLCDLELPYQRQQRSASENDFTFTHCRDREREGSTSTPLSRPGTRIIHVLRRVTTNMNLRFAHKT